MVGSSPLRLLVIDDEADSLSEVEECVKSYDVEVKLLQHSREFSDTVQNWQPGAILMDIVMPDRDGVELLAILSDLRYEGALILMSGSERMYMEMARSIATARGLSRPTILSKPIVEADLLAALELVPRA